MRVRACVRVRVRAPSRLPRTCEMAHARCARRSSAGTARSDGFLQWLNPLSVQSVAHGAEWWTGGGLVHMSSARIGLHVRSGSYAGVRCTIACAQLVHKGRRSRVCKPVKGNVACSRDFAFACLRRGEFAKQAKHAKSRAWALRVAELRVLKDRSLEQIEARNV